jgi:hypothetical protein
MAMSISFIFPLYTSPFTPADIKLVIDMSLTLLRKSLNESIQKLLSIVYFLTISFIIQKLFDLMFLYPSVKTIVGGH